MAQLGRMLVRQCPALQQQCCSCVALNHLLFSTSLPLSTNADLRRGFSPVIYSATRGVHKLVRGLRPRDAPPAPSDLDGNSSGSDSESVTYKSRNALKRDARRAVRWAMDLASFSTPQLKLIIRVAALDEDVLDAVKLLKRFGNDVREGKRRQYNYIAKLLREADTELMDALIRATKDSDQKKLQDLCGLVALSTVEDEVEEEEEEESDEEVEEGSHIEVASRWLEGMINKDVDITKEVYSISDVEFDRQELRKLVRKVHSALECSSNSEENKEKIDKAVVSAQKSLTRYVRFRGLEQLNKYRGVGLYKIQTIYAINVYKKRVLIGKVKGQEGLRRLPAEVVRLQFLSLCSSQKKSKPKFERRVATRN